MQVQFIPCFNPNLELLYIIIKTITTKQVTRVLLWNKYIQNASVPAWHKISLLLSQLGTHSSVSLLAFYMLMYRHCTRSNKKVQNTITSTMSNNLPCKYK